MARVRQKQNVSLNEREKLIFSLLAINRKRKLAVRHRKPIKPLKTVLKEVPRPSPPKPAVSATPPVAGKVVQFKPPESKPEPAQVLRSGLANGAEHINSAETNHVRAPVPLAGEKTFSVKAVLSRDVQVPRELQPDKTETPIERRRRLISESLKRTSSFG